LIMCAMTSPGFQAGQYFWEVLIGHNKISYWECARISVDWKKQYANLNPINGYWITGQETESWYFVNNPNRFCLSLRDNPTWVGIFLDYEDGIWSVPHLYSDTSVWRVTEALHTEIHMMRKMWTHCHLSNVSER
jgi:hypothetical protein